MRVTASDDNDSGGNGWTTTLLVSLALEQLPEEVQETLWNVACSETLGQAAELDGVTLADMVERKARATAAFLRVFNLPMAEAAGVVREPYRPSRRHPRPAWKHYRARCAICRAPVRVRYVGGMHCASCGRAMPVQRVRRGQPKRYCSARCRVAAHTVRNRRSLPIQ